MPSSPALGLLMLAAVALAACSDDTPPSQRGTVTLPGGGTLSDTWSVGCTARGTDSFIQTLELRRDALLIARVYSLGSTVCGSPRTATYAEIDTMIVNTSDPVAVTLGGGAVQAARLSGGALVATLVPNDGNTTVYMNANAYCGLTNWQRGEEQDVGETVCFAHYDFAEPGEIAFRTLIYINSTTTPQRLYFGSASAPQDGEGYPAALDEGFFLHR
jgi:hypothetical protein